MNKITKIAAAVLGVVATMGVAGVANAAMLQIVGDNAGSAPLDANKEAIGDAGGTSYPFAGSAGAASGAGLPTDQGNWPNTTPPAGNPLGFALDTGPAPGNGKYGISGWDASYLKLDLQSAPSATVNFQFMGKGDAAHHDTFNIYGSSGLLFSWDNQSASNGTSCVGTVAGLCTSSGPTDVQSPYLLSSFSHTFTALDLLPGDLLHFEFVNVDTGDISINDGTNNISPDKPPYPSHAGYFLGMDPYLATGQYDPTGKVAYAGFTDLPFSAEGVGDHDYEDLIVRASVPEPGTTLLLGAGLMGLAFGRRRQSQNMA